MTGKQHILYFLSLHRTGLSVTVLALALILFPFLDSNPYTLGLTNLIAINAIVVLGLNLFIGYAVRAGRSSGVPVPLHEELYALLNRNTRRS